jgi:hypothetical protein
MREDLFLNDCAQIHIAVAVQQNRLPVEPAVGLHILVEKNQSLAYLY